MKVVLTPDEVADACGQYVGRKLGLVGLHRIATTFRSDSQSGRLQAVGVEIEEATE